MSLSLPHPYPNSHRVFWKWAVHLTRHAICFLFILFPELKHGTHRLNPNFLFFFLNGLHSWICQNIKTNLCQTNASVIKESLSLRAKSLLVAVVLNSSSCYKLEKGATCACMHLRDELQESRYRQHKNRLEVRIKGSWPEYPSVLELTTPQATKPRSLFTEGQITSAW